MSEYPQRIGFVNGCFDVLHVGHLNLFKFCRSQCDYLIVAIDTDERVRATKGSNRPFNSLEDRKAMLMALRYVDAVESFSTDAELTNLVKVHTPDIMVVGSDWEGKKVIGSEHARQLKFFRKIDGYSTTKILQNSSNR